MFEPLIKLALTKLDTVVDAYVDRQKLINLIAIPGTALFLLLFWGFSGSGGGMLVLAFFLAVAELVIAGGVYVLNDRYADEVRERARVADAIEAFLSDSDIFNEWDDFLGTEQEHPELETLRQDCLRLPEAFPPSTPGDYCSPEGNQLLESLVPGLRTGLASKFVQLAGIWMAQRRARKIAKRAAALDAAALGPLASAEFQPPEHGKPKPPRKMEQIPTLTPARQRAAPTEEEWEEEEEEEPSGTTAPPTVPSEYTDPDELIEREEELFARRKQEWKERKAAEKRAARRAKKTQKKKKKTKKAAEARKKTMMSAPSSDAPMMRPDAIPIGRSARADASARGGNVSEAAAILQIMKRGFTAHDFDERQRALAKQRGRVPPPSEVVRSLLKHPKGLPVKGRKTKRRDAASRRLHARSRRRERRRVARFLFLVGLVGATPFAAFRAPLPNGKPILIEGDVRHLVIDHAPDIRHKLRTPFEELLGYKAIQLRGGERIYVSPADYALCWPESWGAMYDKGYTVHVVAEAMPLLMGGYAPAKITSAERIDRTLTHAR